MKLIYTAMAVVVVATAAFFFFPSEPTPTEQVVDRSSTKEATPEPPPKVQIDKVQKPKADGNNLVIEINDEELPITVSEIELNSFTLPAKPAGYLYDKLSERALGDDPVAARLLSGFITRCNEVFNSKEEHEAAMTNLKEKGEYPSANPRFAGIKVEAEMLAQVEQHFNKEFDACLGLTPDQKNESSRWARIAAENGDFLGIEQLINDPTVDAEERLGLLERQWSDFGFAGGATGVAAVLSGLSKFSAYEGVEPDPKKAYAYFIVSSKIEIALAESLGSSRVSQISSEHGVFESLLTAKLTPAEHLEAEQIAAELIRSNENCCTVDGRQSFLISIGDSDF